MTQHKVMIADVGGQDANIFALAIGLTFHSDETGAILPPLIVEVQGSLTVPRARQLIRSYIERCERAVSNGCRQVTANEACFMVGATHSSPDGNSTSDDKNDSNTDSGSESDSDDPKSTDSVEEAAAEEAVEEVAAEAAPTPPPPPSQPPPEEAEAAEPTDNGAGVGR
jgi:hypothetical protein